MAPQNSKQGKNPANRDSQLFRSLTRLFSGPIISYRSESGRKIRRQHLDKYSTRFKSASGQQFKKQSYNPLDTIAANAIGNQRRSERYIDFDQMEYMPELASALDIYADEMTTFSALSPMLNIRCRNDEIKAVLNILYHNVMNIEHNLFGWCRTMCKYGDFILYLDIDDEVGVQSTIALPLQEVERLEGLDATNPNYIQYQWNSAGMTFENWQVAHFRILGNDKYSPYGTSVLEPARRIWRQLTLMEDAMMAYRIVRSSERKVFKIDVGAIPPQEVEQYMQKIVTQLKRHTIVDKDTGRIDLRYNPLSIEEDYYIPIRAGSVTDIQNLGGGQNTTAIDDIKYLRDKLFSAIKIPQTYLTMGEGAQEDKTTLATKDIRFARTIQRLQRSVLHELEKIGIIHLYTLGYRGEDLLNFKLSLNNPSKIAELQELEHWKTKFDIAASATEGYFSRRWVADNIFGMSHEEFLRNQREMFYDRKHDTALEGVAEAAAAGGGEAGGGGLDLGGDEGGGELDLGGGDELDLGGEGEELDLGGEEEAGGEDEGPLLATPDETELTEADKETTHYTFDDGMTTTSKSKGKMYKPVKVDRRKDGAKKRHNSALANPVGGQRTTKRATGAEELGKLAKGYVFAENKTIYEGEESKIFNSSREIEKLIESLEKVNESKTQ